MWVASQKPSKRRFLGQRNRQAQEAGGAECTADTDALEKAFYAISEKLYAQSQAQGAEGGFDPNAQAGGDGQTYYNADYEDKTNG